MSETSKTVAVIEGDDASPEVIQPAVELIDQMNLGINWTYPVVGEAAKAETGKSFPDVSRAMIDEADTTLFGSSSGSSGASLFYLRWGKQTFANVRPCLHLPGCSSPLAHPEGIDFVIVRENLEDLYVGVEGPLADLTPLNLVGRTVRKPIHELGEGRYAIKVITRQGSERVIRFAFELARTRNGQKRVTSTQKHNMLPGTDGYFLEIAREIASQYPDIDFETFIVDDFACRMIIQPQHFDVIVMPNLYGDILSDGAAGLVGSLGLAASGCYGEDYAYFEPAHGTAPDIAGQGIINPTATLLSACMMLEYLGFEDAAARLQGAVASVYAEGKHLTPDQNGTASTLEFCAATAKRLGIHVP